MDKQHKEDKNGDPQKEGFELEEQQQHSECASSIVGMDSSKMAECFKLMVESMKKKELETIELKQENEKLKQENVKLKEENEALKAEKSRNYSESSSESSIASDFTPEMNTKKRPVKRFINWLRDSLPWIDRKEMAESSLSTSCELFRQLCWPKLHQNVKPYKIRLNIFDHYDIPSFPPPDYILGFEKINFWDVNDQVVNFAKNVVHLLQNCKLEFFSKIPFVPEKMDKKRIASTRALMECLADKIFKIESNNYGPNLNQIKQLFPGILDHVQPNEEEKRQVQDYTTITMFLL